VLSPITISNYGGTCNKSVPAWVKMFTDPDNPPRSAGRVARTIRATEAFGDSSLRTYLHLVDGGVSDNVGMRGVLDSLELMEALHAVGQPTPLDSARRIIVFVVNSLSVPPSDWDGSESPPGFASIMLKAAGVPIDNFSYESIELLKDTAERWRTMNVIRNAPAMKNSSDPVLAAATRVPKAEIFAIDVSFPELGDKAEIDYLNGQPTSFVLPDEAVDRLRAAAGKIILKSPEFQRLMKDIGARIVTSPGNPAVTTAFPAVK
jgi:NTE family protein